MSVYIVTYDLHKEVKRPPLLDDLKNTFPTYAQLSESSYAIVTQSTANAVYDHLRKHLDGNDTLYVITLRRPYAGQGEPEVNNWLAQFLP